MKSKPLAARPQSTVSLPCEDGRQGPQAVGPPRGLAAVPVPPLLLLEGATPPVPEGARLLILSPPHCDISAWSTSLQVSPPQALSSRVRDLGPPVGRAKPTSSAGQGPCTPRMARDGPGAG